MIEGLQLYPAMKDSGVPWLGGVPEHWQVLPNRALFTEVNERGHADEQMLSVTITRGIIRQNVLLEWSSKKDSSNQDKSTYKLVRPGDIAYNKMRAWQSAIGVSHHRGIVSPAYVVVRMRGDNDARYFHHLFRTPQFAKEAERWSYGITSDMWSLRPEHFKMIYCSLPPRNEQVAIIRFLGYIDRRIQRHTRAKQKLIKLLDQQKQAIIHRAVTRGLDHNVRLKPSGVEWQREVPEHWEPWQIGHFAHVGNGSTPSRGNSAYWNGGSYPWLNSSCANLDSVQYADQFVTDTALRECHLPIVPAGSVLVAITGQGKTRGKATVLRIEATINQHVAFITPRAALCSADYLQAALSGAYRQLRAMSEDSGSTKGALTCADLSHFKIALPPLAEQAALLASIRAATSTLHGAVKQTEREVFLLREYHTRLIADVVTGKVDVREAAASLPEEADQAEAFEDADAPDEADTDGADAEREAETEEAAA